MAIKLNDKYVSSFVGKHEILQMQSQVSAAHKMLREKSGPGNDFLGWMDLPVDYDKEEFARIKDTAKKIQQKCETYRFCSRQSAKKVIKYTCTH